VTNESSPPPENVEVEASLLSTLGAPGAESILREHAPNLQADDFVHPEHKTVWRALETFLKTGGEDLNVFSIRKAMEENKGLQVPYTRLLEIMGAEEVRKPEVLIEILVNLRKQRQILRLSDWLSKNYQDTEATTKAIAALSNIRDRSVDDSVSVNAGDLALELAMNFQPFTAGGKDGVLVDTGIGWIDHYIHIARKTVTTIAARGGVGKTTWAIDLASRAARAGRKVRFYSLEMPKEDLLAKTTANFLDLNWGDIRATGIPDYAMQRLASCTDQLRNLSIFEGYAGTPWTDIESDILKHVQRGECDICVLDYLEYIQPTRSHDNQKPHDLWAGLSRDIARLAKKHNIAIILLAQLHRMEDNKEPHTGNLASTDSLQKDSANMLFLYMMNNTQYWAKLGKTRYGAKCAPKMVAFDGARNRVMAMEFSEAPVLQKKSARPIARPIVNVDDSTD
jgi:replicative DNA helicase